MDPNAIAATLRDEIERGALVAGTPLRQEELAARFGVSRLPVRRALDRLLAIGVVERRTDRSVAVRGYDATAARELVEVRVALETAALRVSLRRLDDAALRRARRVTDAMLDEEDAAELEELDVRFHELLYGACDNARLRRMIAELRREGRLIYALQTAGTVDRARLHAEHRAILAACAARDVAGAVDALAAHLAGTITHITERRGSRT